jgi:hypothetical protein
MATRNTRNPCATEERTSNDSLQRERRADEVHAAAWKRFNSDPVRRMVSARDFTAIRNRLTVGQWPEDLLGSVSSPDKTTFERCAKAVYDARTALDEATEAASEDRAAWVACKRTPEYRAWVKSQAQGGGGGGGGSGGGKRCGKPCVGHGNEGRPCQVLVGKDGTCQYHG